MADPEEAGVRERVYMWRSGLAMWRERPVLGIGPGGVKREYPAYALPEAVKKRTSHVHSTPLQILVERGVLGLAAWLAIWAAFVIRCIALLRRLPSEATAGRVLVVGSLAAIVALPGGRPLRVQLRRLRSGHGRVGPDGATVGPRKNARATNLAVNERPRTGGVRGPFLGPRIQTSLKR